MFDTVDEKEKFKVVFFCKIRYLDYTVKKRFAKNFLYKTVIIAVFHFISISMKLVKGNDKMKSTNLIVINGIRTFQNTIFKAK